MTTLGTYTHDSLIGGDFPLVTAEVTVLDGQDISRGALMGIVTASGKAIISDSAASDGSEVAYGVLTEDVNADGADVVSSVYLTGQFNDQALSFGGSDTVDDRRADMRALSMFARAYVPA